MSTDQDLDANGLVLEPLTQRELEILALYAAGYNNPEAAGQLFLAESTVKWYARQIYGKLGVNDREAAISKAYTLGLLAPKHTFDSLPAALTPLIGRENELRTVQRQLLNPNCRLLTISGPGGIGKTRLAQQVAHNLAGQHSVVFRDGICFVRLEPVSHLVTAIASGLNLDAFGGDADPRQQLLAYLRRKRLLILLDNFESFSGTPEAVWLVELLIAAGGVKLLVTSQVRLGLPGEQIFPLDGLELPTVGEKSLEQAAAYGSIELFLHAARRNRPDFQLTTENLGAVVRICRLLEGSPLGIDLAAGWIGVFSAHEILAEVKASLDFLETSRQAVPDRQRSLRAVFASSWRMLDEAGRAAAKRLVAFHGGFDITAVRQIAGLSPRELMNLFNKSWIQRDASGRFRFYDPLRIYIEEIATREAAWDGVCQEHSAYFCSLAERQGPRLYTYDFKDALNKLRSEQDNLRSAWQWIVRHHRWDLVSQVLDGICTYIHLFGSFSEGEAYCSLAAAEILDSTYVGADYLPAHLLCWQAVFTGNPQAATSLLARAQSLLDQIGGRSDPDYWRVQAFIWQQMGQAIAWRDRTRAIELFEQSLVSYQELGDERAVAELMTNLGWANWTIRKFEAAQVWLESALGVQRRVGDMFFASKSLILLGLVARLSGRLEEAVHLHEESLAHYRTLGSHMGLADALFVLSNTLIMNGQWEKAEQCARESLAEFARVGYEGPFLAKPYTALAGVLIGRGDYSMSRSAALKGLNLARLYGNRQEVAFSQWQLGRLDLLEHQYEHAYQKFDECLKIFSDLKHRGVIHLLAYLPFLSLGRGETDRARQEMTQAIIQAIEQDDIEAATAIFPPTILYLKKAGYHEQALDLFVFASLFPLYQDNRWFMELCGESLAEKSVVRSAAENRRLSEAERAGQVMEKLKQLHSFLEQT